MDHCSMSFMSFYHNNVRDKYFNIIRYILYNFLAEIQMTYFKNKEHIIVISYNSPHICQSKNTFMITIQKIQNIFVLCNTHQYFVKFILII